MQVDRSKGTDVATASELTELLVDKLQGHHVPTARFEGELSMPAYQLACEVTDMASTQTRGYPRHVRYKAELNCTIKDPSTHEIRWQRRLDQEYEEAVLFNMMTKRQERHDWVLYRECVVPLWDAMAYGVKLFLSRPTPQAPEAPPPEIPAEPVPSLYVK